MPPEVYFTCFENFEIILLFFSTEYIYISIITPKTLSWHILCYVTLIYSNNSYFKIHTIGSVYYIRESFSLEYLRRGETGIIVREK